MLLQDSLIHNQSSTLHTSLNHTNTERWLVNTTSSDSILCCDWLIIIVSNSIIICSHLRYLHTHTAEIITKLITVKQPRDTDPEHLHLRKSSQHAGAGNLTFTHVHINPVKAGQTSKLGSVFMWLIPVLSNWYLNLPNMGEKEFVEVGKLKLQQDQLIDPFHTMCFGCNE